jgi:hypothetical protein
MVGTGLGLTKLLNAQTNLNVSLQKVCVYDNYIKGISHFQNVIHQIEWEAPLKERLERELHNKYDRFAIATYVQDKKNGYIAAYENIVIAKMMDSGVEIIPNIEQDTSIELKNIPYFRPDIYIQLFTELIIPSDTIPNLNMNLKRSDDQPDKYRQGWNYEENS